MMVVCIIVFVVYYTDQGMTAGVCLSGVGFTQSYRTRPAEAVK